MKIKTPTGHYEITWFQHQRMGWLAKRKRPFQRADLMHKFDISVPQASKDIQMFNRIWPGHWKYNVNLKRYERVK